MNDSLLRGPLAIVAGEITALNDEFEGPKGNENDTVDFSRYANRAVFKAIETFNTYYDYRNKVLPSYNLEARNEAMHMWLKGCEAAAHMGLVPEMGMRAAMIAAFNKAAAVYG